MGEEFPFNWFPLREGNDSLREYSDRPAPVSIQLVSPARGEPLNFTSPTRTNEQCFHSISFPCERGTQHQQALEVTKKFPFN